jgi:hypothetical protein
MARSEKCRQYRRDESDGQCESGVSILKKAIAACQRQHGCSRKKISRVLFFFVGRFDDEYGPCRSGTHATYALEHMHCKREGTRTQAILNYRNRSKLTINPQETLNNSAILDIIFL